MRGNIIGRIGCFHDRPGSWLSRLSLVSFIFPVLWLVESPVWSEVNDFSRLGLRLDSDSWLLVAGAAQTQTLHSAIADVNSNNNSEPVPGYLRNLSTSHSNFGHQKINGASLDYTDDKTKLLEGNTIAEGFRSWIIIFLSKYFWHSMKAGLAVFIWSLKSHLFCWIWIFSIKYLRIGWYCNPFHNSRELKRASRHLSGLTCRGLQCCSCIMVWPLQPTAVAWDRTQNTLYLIDQSRA